MLVTILAVLAGIVLAFIVAGIFSAIVRAAAHRSQISSDLTARSRRPLRLVLVIVATWAAILVTTEPQDEWTQLVGQVLRIALIASSAWLVGTLAFVVEDAALSRFRLDVPDNRHARRVRTQVTILRRLTVAILVVGAIAAVLLTFPAAQTFGRALLASAGLLSIVAGLAAQSSLANLFAGLQLVFTDAIRVDDVVVVDDEWGRIEELTLTYVVVHVWDDRRLILPSVYFTTTPFENWTRRAADLLGTVELDLDWAVPVDEMRAELTNLLAATDLWDERVGILQVTEATGGWVRVRALASAADAPTLFDLRCYMREGLVAWVQRAAPQALPRTRLENVASADGSVTAPAPAPAPAPGSEVARARVPSDVPRGSATRRAPSQAPRPAEVSAPVAAVTGDAVTRRSARSSFDPGAPQAGDTQWLDLGPQDARLFTGSIDAIERSRAFSGPGEDVIAAREQVAADSEGGPGHGSGPVTVVGPPLRAQAPEPRETSATRAPVPTRAPSASLAPMRPPSAPSVPPAPTREAYEPYEPQAASGPAPVPRRGSVIPRGPAGPRGPVAPWGPGVPGESGAGETEVFPRDDDLRSRGRERRRGGEPGGEGRYDWRG